MPEGTETVRAPIPAGGSPTIAGTGDVMPRTATAQAVRTEITTVTTMERTARRRITPGDPLE